MNYETLNYVHFRQKWKYEYYTWDDENCTIDSTVPFVDLVPELWDTAGLCYRCWDVCVRDRPQCSVRRNVQLAVQWTVDCVIVAVKWRVSVRSCGVWTMRRLSVQLTGNAWYVTVVTHITDWHALFVGPSFSQGDHSSWKDHFPSLESHGKGWWCPGI